MANTVVKNWHGDGLEPAVERQRSPPVTPAFVVVLEAAILVEEEDLGHRDFRCSELDRERIYPGEWL